MRVALVISLVAWLGGSGFELEARAASNGDDSAHTTISLEALSRLKGIDLDSNPSLKGIVVKLLDQVRGTPQFLEIVRDFKIKDQEQGLIDLAEKEPASQAGVESIRLVLDGGNSTLVQKALMTTNAQGLAEALGNTGDKAVVPLLTPIVSDTQRDLALRKQAVKSLAKVREGAADLVELAKEEKLPPDLKLAASMELNAVRWEDLKAEAARLLPLPQGHDAKPLPPMSELIKLPGDAKKGAEIFRSEAIGCLKCHQINGEGIDFGPNLSEIGTKLAKEALFEAILDPSAGISFGFEAWQIELKGGDEAYGLIVSETADELAVKAVGGVVTRYKKSEILRRAQQKLSIMPAGLEKTMSLQDLVNLVEYLSSLKKAGK